MVSSIEIAIMVVILCGMMTFLYVFMTISKASKFRLRVFQGNRSYVEDYSMMEKRNKKDNSTYWVSVPWQKKIKVYDPPNECIDIGRKGKKFLEGYKLSEDEFLFVRDKGFTGDSILSTGKRFGESFEPFSTTERDALINQYEKAEAQRSKSLWRSEVIVPGVALMSMTVIIVCLMIFWGDIAQPALDSHNLALEVQDQNIKIAQALGVSIDTISVNSGTDLSISLPDELTDILPDGR